MANIEFKWLIFLNNVHFETFVYRSVMILNLQGTIVLVISFESDYKYYNPEILCYLLYLE